MPEFPTLRHTISDIRMRYAPDRATAKGACSDFSYLYRSNLQHRHDPADRIHTTPPHPRLSPRHGRNHGQPADAAVAGLVHLFIKHTSAGLSINENADPDVRTDLSAIFDRLVRERESYYVHTLEGDDDMPAHAKSTLTGVELTIPVTQGRLNLGTWQGIYLCEFRNRASGRRIVATLIG